MFKQTGRGKENEKIPIVLPAFSMLVLTACGDKDIVSTENNTPTQTNTITIVTDNQQPVQQNDSGVIYNDIFNEDGNLVSVCNLFKFLQDAEPSFKLTDKADSTLSKEEKKFVIAINEELIENLTISTIQVNNPNGDIYYIYSLNAHDDVFVGDIINIHDFL